MPIRKRSSPAGFTSVEFPENYLGFLLARLSHLASETIHRNVEEIGATVWNWRILSALSDRERTVGELCRLALMKQPTLSKALDRLETMGYVTRRRPETERRTVLVSLTPVGRNLARRLRVLAAADEAALCQTLEAERFETLKRILKEAIAALEAAE